MMKSKSSSEVPLDRRRLVDRRQKERRQAHVPVAVERRQGERRAKTARRRQIDPTTCERDYTADEVEFMRALDDYKRRSGRMFPTCSEILEVLRGLGYVKIQQQAPISDAGEVSGAEPANPETPPTVSC
jgi:hypothetical protein